MKIPLSLLMILIVSNYAFDLAAAEMSDAKSDEQAIREARSEFNQAIREQDVDTIISFFAPDYHLITGNSRQAHGIDEQQKMWADAFDQDSGFYCHREVRELRINEKWGLAEELGDWNCYFQQKNKPTHYSGVYSAKWQRDTQRQWLIQSEVFTTMLCKSNGSGCSPPPDISRSQEVPAN